MRVYFNKKHIRGVLLALFIVLVFLGLLKLVSWWDSRQGIIDASSIPTPTPPISKQEPEIPVREPTEEEREGLANGSVTKDKLIQNIVSDALNTVKPSQSAQPEYDRRIAQICAEVYVLREEYILELEKMYKEAEGKLSALASQEDTEEETASLVSAYLTKAMELEKQCDAKIDIIIVEMEALIKAYNGDMGLVDTLVETYVTEKATKKADYIDRLEKKGLIS